MIAIAIIGILALVLIPRVAGLKDNARAAGLDSTIRVAMSIAEGVVDNYTADAAGCGQLEEYLTTKLPANAAENPNTKNKTVKVKSEVVGGDAAFANTVEGATPEFTGEDAKEGFAGTEELKGVVLFDAFVDSDDKLKVQFQGVDASGTLVGTAKITN